MLKEEKQSQEDPFIVVYDTYFDRVNRYLRYRVANTWDADDLTAQVFIKAYESFDQCRNKDRISAWIFQIAHNTYIDFLRRRKEHLPLKEELLSVSEGSHPEEMALAGEELLFLKSCLNQLAGEQRDVILLRYFGDLKYSQIAQVLDKKEATVKTMGFRALRKLRNLLEKEQVVKK